MPAGRIATRYGGTCDDSLMAAPANRASELDAARRELQALYRRLAATRPFSWNRMGDQMKIARVKRRIAELERAEQTNPL